MTRYYYYAIVYYTRAGTPVVRTNRIAPSRADGVATRAVTPEPSINVQP